MPFELGCVQGDCVQSFPRNGGFGNGSHKSGHCIHHNNQYITSNSYPWVTTGFSKVTLGYCLLVETQCNFNVLIPRFPEQETKLCI